jgi:hypothetical protein
MRNNVIKPLNQYFKNAICRSYQNILKINLLVVQVAVLLGDVLAVLRIFTDLLGNVLTDLLGDWKTHLQGKIKCYSGGYIMGQVGLNIYFSRCIALIFYPNSY